MNFQAGMKYHTRNGQIVRIKRYTPDKRNFIGELLGEVSSPDGKRKETFPVCEITYNEAGDAIKPNDPGYDLMMRCKIPERY